MRNSKTQRHLGAIVCVCKRIGSGTVRRP